jgi:GT2 family glycosyltransferase
MDVSIIIINYNTFALTCACIQSVRDNTKDLQYEIILVDNNSTETDPDEFLKSFPGLVLIKSPINVGFAKGCNLGVASAKGNTILLLNSDTVLENNAVGICKKFLDENPRVGVVSSLLLYPDGGVQHNCQRFPSILYGLFELFRLQKFLPRKLAGKVLFGPFFEYNTIAYPDWVWGTFFMFRKDKLERLPEKKLNDDFFMYAEDMLWCKDFSLAGYKIAFEPTARVIHYMGKSGGSKNNLIERHTAVFLKEYYNKWQLSMIDWINRQLSSGQFFQ